MKWIKILIYVVFLKVSNSEHLTGYDCGTGLPNVTTISLTKVGDCNIEIEEPQIKSMPLQLLQSIEHEPITVYQCRIRVDEHITYCGMHSHNSEVKHGEYTYTVSMNRETCLDIVRFGQFKFGRTIINDVLVNATTRRTVTVAGILEANGKCNGEIYSNEFNEYKDVVVTAKLVISIFQYVIAVNINRNELTLPSGTKCDYKIGKCTDVNENSAFWEVQKPTACGFEKYAILFEGMGVKVTDKSMRAVDVYFANSTSEVRFGLSKTGERSVCGYRVIETDHPRLFITEYTSNQGFATKHRLEVQDILMSAYFNTKIAFLERHIKSQFKEMYRDILFHRCRLERQTILNSMAYLYIKPDLFAFIVMKQPGYMAIPAGEVAHLVPCQPIPCRIREMIECYQEIPVECKNDTFFLKPLSRIMIKTGTPKDCNRLLPSTFNIASTWVQLIPTPLSAEAPQIIEPLQKPTWKYRDLEGLINSGIYTSADLERLQIHMIFPAEKPASLETLARKISDQPIPRSSINFKNLLDRDAIEDMAKSSWTKIWNKFEKFGIYSAGILGIFMIIYFIKSVIDAIIQGYTLYTIFGWGIHILGAIFSSITNLIVHVKTRPTTANEKSISSNNDSRVPTAPINNIINNV